MFGAVASQPHAPLHAIGPNDPTIADWPIQKYRQHSDITRVFANRADNNPPPTTAPLGQHHISTTSGVARAFAPWGRPWICWPIQIRKKCGQPSKTKKKKILLTPNKGAKTCCSRCPSSLENSCYATAQHTWWCGKLVLYLRENWKRSVNMDNKACAWRDSKEDCERLLPATMKTQN